MMIPSSAPASIAMPLHLPVLAREGQATRVAEGVVDRALAVPPQSRQHPLQPLHRLRRAFKFRVTTAVHLFAMVRCD